MNLSSRLIIVGMNSTRMKNGKKMQLMPAYSITSIIETCTQSVPFLNTMTIIKTCHFISDMTIIEEGHSQHETIGRLNTEMTDHAGTNMNAWAAHTMIITTIETMSVITEMNTDDMAKEVMTMAMTDYHKKDKDMETTSIEDAEHQVGHMIHSLHHPPERENTMARK